MLNLRSAFGLLLAGHLVFGAAAQSASQPQTPPSSPPPATLADLQQRLTDEVSQPRFASALWGVKVISLDTGRTLFEHDAQKLFSPASNSKLYTVALALDRLGGDYRIKTSLYAKAKPEADGTLKGDLILYGRGDPTINARLHGGDIYRALAPLVSALTNAGVKRIEGDLVGDESFIRGAEFGSGWCWEDAEYYYGAEISALTINDNTLQITIKPGKEPGALCQVALSPATTYLAISNQTRTVEKGGAQSLHLYRPLEQNVVYVSGQMPLEATTYTDDVTLHRPAGLFLTHLREALARHGIQVEGKLRIADWRDRLHEPIDCSKLVELGFLESLPMRDLAREVEKPSQNLYTDLLLAQVGESRRTSATPPERSSESLGIQELNRFLGEVGVPKGQVLFEEGSGLSRDNLTTPNATVTLLKFMRHHQCGDAYDQALPIAGVDGTLRNRMKKTPAAGNVHAKTGSLRWASSLSGYVTSAAGEHLAFSFMLNRYYNPAGSARADLDTLAVLLASFTGRSE